MGGFERLSPESRYRRFFRSMEQMSERDLAYLTNIDHHDHEAILALDPETDAALGVARYVRDRDNPSSAEAAVVVADDWQGRGLGKLLLERLSSRAMDEGIERFTALVQADNHRAVTLLASLGPTERSQSSSLIELDIELQRDGLSSPLARALQAAAGSLFGTRPLSERILRKAHELYFGDVSDVARRYSLTAPIVVGTDGSDGATAAVERAAELAARLHAPLHVVCAYRDFSERLLRTARLDIAAALPSGLNPRGAAEATVQRAITLVADRELELVASAHVEPGGPAEVLLSVAEDVGAQLVVVGDKGMHGASRFVIGSVPDKLSHEGSFNVLITNTGE